MVKTPEFISILKNIKDVIYPSLSAASDSLTEFDKLVNAYGSVEELILALDNAGGGELAASTSVNAEGSATCWANFDGTDYDVNGYCTIKSSYNVQTVQRISAGVYVVKPITPFDNADYLIGGMAREVAGVSASQFGLRDVGAQTLTEFEVYIFNLYFTTAKDASNINFFTYGGVTVE